MSGHKRTTVTISQEEYRRLYDAERKNYYQTFEIPEEVIFPILQQNHNHLYSSYQQIANRQSSYENVIDSFQNQIKAVEKKTSESLVDQQIAFYNSLIESSENLWKDTSNVLLNQTREFEQNVRIQHDELIDNLTSIQQDITNNNNRRSKVKSFAEQWYQDSIKIFNFIQTSYPPELINFPMLDNLRQQLSYASTNLDNEIYEACLTVCQQVFANLSSYRLELENVFSKSQAAYISLFNHLQIIRQQCEGLNSIQAIDINGEMLDEYLDGNYWSENQPTRLLNEIDQLFDHLQYGGNWSNESLIFSITEETIPRILNEVGDITHETRRKALNAQLRYNTAQLVLISLISQGYRPVVGEFNEQDLRNGYLATASGPDGSTITIKVEPSEGISSDLEIITSNANFLTESELKHRTIEIMQSIEPYGLKIGKIEEVTSQTNREKSSTSKGKTKTIQSTRS